VAQLSKINDILEDGFVRVDKLVAEEELLSIRTAIYSLIERQIDAGGHRADLGATYRTRSSEYENVTQIMWPSVYITWLRKSKAFLSARNLAREMLGQDLTFDFDMIFFKAPQTHTPTPFHQDMAYWPTLPDLRAVSCWIALDDVTVDSGCLWFVRGREHRRPRPHFVWDKVAGTLACHAEEGDAIPVPLEAGDCTFHLGDTVHYSRGNSSNTQRAGLVVNFRPVQMVRLERSMGFDHGLTGNLRQNRNTLTKSSSAKEWQQENEIIPGA
jgi:ectoine hydroxylase-related dioxygenase (phytanoyl-CoA dioxygenase family)